MNVIIATASSGDPLIDWLTQAGATGVLVFVIFGFMKGWIVPGSYLKKALDDRDKALDLVYKQAEIAQRAIEAGEKK